MITIRNIFVVILGILCFCNLFLSWDKYRMGRELTFTQFREVKSVHYPSVTVCKSAMFDTYLDDELFDNESITIMQKKELFIKHSLNLSRTVTFLSHPNILNLKFPCLTTSESVSPNRPCAFPYKYDDYRSRAAKF